MKPIAALLLLPLLGCGCGGGAGGGGFPAVPSVEQNTTRSLTGGPFCCDAGGSFPQEIGVLSIRNDYPDTRTIDVIIGPFSSGVVTEDGVMTQRTLQPGDVLDTRLLATRCDWETAQGNLIITTGSNPGATPGASFVQGILLENQCPLQMDRIVTNLEISGLARAHFDTLNDPPPVGTDPVLYVTGPSTNAGVEVYAIQRNAAGLIATTPRVETIGIPVQPIPMSGPGDDIVPVSAGVGPLPGTGKLTRALYPFGPGGYARTHWNMGWGGLLIGGSVKDLVSFGGGSRSTGVSYANGLYARFEEYDPSVNFFSTPTPTGQLGGEFHFPNHTGDPVSVFVEDFSGGAIIVMDGSPGQVWFHDRVDTLQPASLVGVAGNDPRQVRAANGLAAISNYASNTVSLMSWDGPFVPIPTATLTMGPTPPANPLKLDMIALSNGNTALAVASDTSDRWWVAELDGAGAVVESWTGDYGISGELADIVFLPGSPTYIAIALKGYRVVQLIAIQRNSPAQ